jgi:hypothetical protein
VTREHAQYPISTHLPRTSSIAGRVGRDASRRHRSYAPSARRLGTVKPAGGSNEDENK